MAVIKKLAPEVASKIAAGEVVEKPFNVVKELIENSCDAGAKKITVEIVNGGLDLIKITDDGHGIDKDDLPLTVERFATSKAQTVEDVYAASTFGFRGEALAAISSVSDFKIISGKNGRAYEMACKYGNIEEVKPAPAIKGTMIEASRLFENLPARRKFLKSSKSLEGEILRLIKHFSLINENIEISLTSDNKLLYHAKQSEDVVMRASKVFTGKAFVKGEALYEDKKVNACVTLPSASDRLKRDAIIIGVNGRLIKDNSLVQAVINSYHRLIPDGRYPLAVIDIRMNPSNLDANVHPAKMEVRFLNGGEMFSLVTDACSGAFTGRGVNTSYHHKESSSSFVIEDNKQNNIQEKKHISYSIENIPQNNSHNYTKESYNAKKEVTVPQADYSFKIDEKLEQVSIKNNTDIQQTYHTNNTQEIDNSLDERIAKGEFRVVGQIDKTYIIIETENKEILFIDQHAAHERILFEKLQAENQTSAKPSIVLHDAIEVILTDEIIENIDNYNMIIESFGYGYKITGIDKLEISRIPYHMVRKNIAKEFSKIAADLCLTGKSKNEEAPRAMLSCKSAIKAGDELTYAEMEYLVMLLFNTNNFGTCPHGRPIIYLMRVDELARKFYR